MDTGGRACARLGPALAAICAAASLSGCIGYHRLPLPAAPDSATSLASLKVDVAALRLEPLRQIHLAPDQPLTPLAVAVLAALDNPELRARRAALGVDSAAVIAAGLLPEPQISFGSDKPVAGPDTHTAVNVSPSFDVAALLQTASRAHAARFRARQASLDELWAEWTTAQHARTLAETALTDDARARFLDRLAELAGARARASAKAEARGDETASAANADLAVQLDAETLAASAKAGAAAARRSLDVLLGLDPSVNLPLTQGAAPRALGPETIAGDLASLPRRRPDLLALQAGYGAADADLRRAILAQFPLAQIAFAYARDPTPTTTLGFAAVAALPIFGHARAEVRVQEATRSALRAEYQARLDGAAAEAKDAAAELTEANAQAATLRAALPALERSLRARSAYERGDIDSQAWLALSQTVISREADLEDRELAARMAEIRLETALFAPPAALEERP